MSGDRLDAAKVAATTFLSTLPKDVNVGVVTFADIARTEIPPTRDRAAVRTVIDNIVLSERVGTALFDGLAQAADLTGSTGARSVLLLTDGDEAGESKTSLEDAAAAATADDVAVDAVYIGPPDERPPELTNLMTEAGGQVTSSDPADLARHLPGNGRGDQQPVADRGRAARRHHRVRQRRGHRRGRRPHADRLGASVRSPSPGPGSRRTPARCRCGTPLRCPRSAGPACRSSSARCSSAWWRCCSSR